MAVYETTPVTDEIVEEIQAGHKLLLVVAGSRVQAEYWMRKLEIPPNRFTYVSSATALRGRTDCKIIYAGNWSSQSAALEVFEALAWAAVESDRHTCGDPWEDEQEWGLYSMRLNMERARREFEAAQAALLADMQNFEVERRKHQHDLVIANLVDGQH